MPGRSGIPAASALFRSGWDEYLNRPLKKIALVKSEAASVEQKLYEVRKKIYPRAVTGWFATWRVVVVLLTQLLYYGAPWLTWNGRPAVLFDLAARKFYIFELVLFPQDFIFLAALLVISALSLFLFTAVGGRLFCGYACPQTVYTEIFLWIERRIEGDPLKQMKLDGRPWGPRKLALKAAKHGAWIAVAFWTGLTFVGYFTPIRVLLQELGHFGFGPWETFWVLFYGFATYGNAGWMREQVCKYMCPYARFQGVMFDPDTLVITYDVKRGEPRGARSKSADYREKGLGDCVDCGICVQVCPTGIDIRNGLQYECIGCAACIDACDQVMDKMGYPRGLIRYSTENAMAGKYPDTGILARLFRPRVLVYAGVLTAILVAFGATLYARVPLKVNIMRDRVAMVREAADGSIENVYRIQIINTAEHGHRYILTASGDGDLRLLPLREVVDVAPAATRIVAVRLRGLPREDQEGAQPVTFRVEALDDPRLSVEERANFMIGR